MVSRGLHPGPKQDFDDLAADLRARVKQLIDETREEFGLLAHRSGAELDRLVNNGRHFQSQEFAFARWLCVGALAFAIVGIGFGIAGALSVRDEKIEIVRELRAEDATAYGQLRGIIDDARRQTAERREALRDQEEATFRQLGRLQSDLKDAKLEIANASRDFKERKEELRKEVVTTLTRQLQDDLSRANKDLVAQVTAKMPPGPLPNCMISRASCSEVQKALNKKLGMTLRIDGVVGPATRAAFRAFQVVIGSTEADSLSDGDTKQLFAP
jgi:hypothetical protein